jgi:hypothetical protein
MRIASVGDVDMLPMVEDAASHLMVNGRKLADKHRRSRRPIKPDFVCITDKEYKELSGPDIYISGRV